MSRATRIATLLVLIFAVASAKGMEPQAGRHYQLVGEPPSEPMERVRVSEFFSYACPFCGDFYPIIDEWAAEYGDLIDNKPVAVVFRSEWEPLARAYWVAVELDAVDDIHGPLFRALHQERRPVTDKESLVAFFAERGLDEDEVRRTWDSFSVQTAMNRADRQVTAVGVQVTPSVVVADAYLVTPRMVGSLEGMVEVIDALVRRHLAEAR